MINKKPNYTSLAPLYDKLMEDVDYEAWADYIDEVIQTHHESAERVLEMACGTGSLALSLEDFGYYKILATDLSPEMIDVAKEKAEDSFSEVRFDVQDFLNLTLTEKFDVIFSAFDSINYLHSSEEILDFLKQSSKLLNPSGILIFDFSTPLNSIESVDYLNDEEAQVGQLRYFRKSSYENEQRLHYNEFEIEMLDQNNKEVVQTYSEVHVQKAYELSEILSIVEQSPYYTVAKYDGFDFIEATEKSARVTIVLKCQKPQ